MVGALTLYQTTIGKKVVMAVTGLVLFAYVFVHMLGNLKVYSGPAYLNAYGVFLREVGYPLFAHESVLWIARIVLLVSVGLHIWAAYQLTRVDLAGRPIHYASRKHLAASFAARTMRWSGVILGLFIVFHVLDLTTGTLHPGTFIEGDVYHNVTTSFGNPVVSLVYIVAQVALALHLYHGVWSMSQTMGWRSAANNSLWKGFATVSAVIIAAGNISIPLAVLLGIVR
ncbi:MAG: succinate dehydrogenase cytochrome b subunit [Chloroflexota bacterium]|nr:succinate dehydrogenase cytochrome b subunit [Chloroflexota bacterium]